MKTNPKNNTKNMENKIKKRGGRSLEWYQTVIRAIGTSIVNTNELSDILAKTDETLGYNDAYTVKKCIGLKNIQTILGESKYDIVEDNSVKARGRSKGFLFSLKLDKDETIDDVIKYISEKFESEARNSYRREKKVLSDDTEEETKTEPSKIEISKEAVGKHIPEHKTAVIGAKADGVISYPTARKRKSDRTNLYYLWKLVSTLYKRKVSSISLPYNFSLKADGPITKMDLKDWIYSAKANGIKPDIVFNSTRGRNAKSYANFFNLQNLILTLSEKGKDLGLVFDTKKVLNYKPLNEAREEARKEVPTLTPQERDIVWIVAATIKECGKPQDIEDLCKLLRDEYDKSCLRRDLESILKKTPEIYVSNTGFSLVSLNKPLIGDDVWEVILKKYSPATQHHQVLARISMSLEELQQFFPMSEVVSRISDSEAIYKIVYDDSESSKLSLLVLVLGFRGTDMLLDPELEKMIKNELLSAVRESLMVANPRFRMENLEK